MCLPLAFASSLPTIDSSPSSDTVLRREWRIPEATVQHSLVGMLFCLGAGGLFVVVLAAFVGRLPVLVSFQVMTTATGIWCAKVVSFDEYMAARIVNGFFGSLAQAVRMTLP